MSSLLLSPKKLNQMLSTSKNIKVLDASWFMPNSTRNAKAEFLVKHLPGAQYLDLDKVASSHELGLKHMMPTASVFADACGKFGILPSTSVVLYDSHGVFSSPRALFMFRSFGHVNSSILNGGLPLWENSGLAIENGEAARPQVADYPTPQLDVNAIRDYTQMVANSSIESGAEIVLDARSQGRFQGIDPEPRPGLSSGHMPNSYSMPFNTFLDTETASNGASYTVMKSPAEIRQALTDAHLEAIMKGSASVATTCGSGMTAAVLWLGLKLLGVERIGLYDESWTGYAMRPSSVIRKSG